MNLSYVKQLKSEVSCVYLIENVIDNPSTILTDNPGHIELHVSWKTPSVDIPLHEASTNVVSNLIFLIKNYCLPMA